MTISLRPTRAAIRISGTDAQKWLNDVLTAPIRAEAGFVAWWALLSAQGKVQAEGLISWHDDGFWLDVDATIADAFIKRMRLYKLRAAAEIEDLRESHAVGWAETGIDGTISDKDPRQENLGFRIIAQRDGTTGWMQDDHAYAVKRIAAGIAEMGADFTADSVFPHDIGMDLLHGVDFNKGCYVGQEVVSRMQHRGTARRRPVIVSGAALQTGGAVQVGTKDTGTVGTVVDGKAIGLLRIDRLSTPEEAVSGDAPVQLALPDWASYAFADSAGSSDAPES